MGILSEVESKLHDAVHAVLGEAEKDEPALTAGGEAVLEAALTAAGVPAELGGPLQELLTAIVAHFSQGTTPPAAVAGDAGIWQAAVPGAAPEPGTPA
jgi:hypothetical protein